MKLSFLVEPKWLPDSLAAFVGCLYSLLPPKLSRRVYKQDCCLPSFRPINLQQEEERVCDCMVRYVLGRVLEEGISARFQQTRLSKKKDNKQKIGEGVPLQKPWKPN